MVHGIACPVDGNAEREAEISGGLYGWFLILSERNFYLPCRDDPLVLQEPWQVGLG